MPEYKAPGVYVEEVERGPKPIEGVSTSVAGFLGRTERGPTDPELITSFAGFQRTFGGYAHYKRGGRLEGTFLAYAVDGFFRNGGGRCYVGRVIDEAVVGNEDATASTSLANDDDIDVINVSAVGPGIWGHNVALLVDDATRYDPDDDDNQLFRVTVKYWAEDGDVPRPDDPTTLSADDIQTVMEAESDVEEVYDNLSPREAAGNFFETEINNTSELIEVAQVDDLDPDVDLRPSTGDVTTNDGEELPDLLVLDEPSEEMWPDDPDGREVSDGDFEGNAEKGEKTGLEAFAEVDEISMVGAPDEVNIDGVTSALKDHCENEDLQDRVAVLSAGEDFDISNPEVPVTSSYAAFYFPWIEVRDPVTGQLKEIPPSGHLAGIYARSDQERGVHKAPANEIVRGASELETTVTKAEQESLNPLGVNCIRSFRGRGIRVWGARTTASDPQWKYVNVRRLFNFLKESIDEGTQWVVFEPNDEELWARVRQTINNFLRSVWEDGALMGTTPEEAYYVKCDRSTMTQNDIDNGRLICEIGIAPVKPAEFVVFRISQWTGGGE